MVDSDDKGELNRKLKCLADYKPLKFSSCDQDLTFDLRDYFKDGSVLVTSRQKYKYSCRSETSPEGADRVDWVFGDLVLDGRNMQLLSLSFEGQQLASRYYLVSSDKLFIKLGDFLSSLSKLPLGREGFELEIKTLIHPASNTDLMGLYAAGDHLMTQCEPEGFRSITYCYDRPDCLGVYSVTIISNENDFESLLSNGNCLSDETVSAVRTVSYHDPYPKPCYLFALVAGSFDVIAEDFVTSTGKKVDCRIYVTRGKGHLAYFALESLHRAMAFDERRFACVYDLDSFAIVATDKFNFGAMENKSLNIFFDKLILGDTSIATDNELQTIDAIIAHEYLHNYSGNRITCSNWFNLCYKEGFTVFREQSYVAEHYGKEVSRLSDVIFLESVQFKEDRGALAHAIRSDSYEEIENFYTATVYEKGAECVRQLKLLFGEEDFYRAIGLFFSHFDGRAIGIEEFLSSFAGALSGSYRELEQGRLPQEQPKQQPKQRSEQKLEGARTVIGEQIGSDNFMVKYLNWYKNIGQVEVSIKLRSKNSTDSSLGRSLVFDFSVASSKDNLPIAVDCVFLKHDGSKIASSGINCGGGIYYLHSSVYLLLGEGSMQVDCSGDDKVSISPFRGLSSPVVWHYDYDFSDLVCLIDHEDDLYSRYKARRRLILSSLAAAAQLDWSHSFTHLAPLLDEIAEFKNWRSVEEKLLTELVDITEQSFIKKREQGFCSLVLIPKLADLLPYAKKFDKLSHLKKALDISCARIFYSCYSDLLTVAEHYFSCGNNTQFDEVSRGHREFYNAVLDRLVLGSYFADSSEVLDLIDLVTGNYTEANNFTLKLASLKAVFALKSNLQNSDIFDSSDILEAMIKLDKAVSQLSSRYQQDYSFEPLLLDHLQMLRGSVTSPETFEEVEMQYFSEGFDRTSPARIRALLGGFMQNLLNLHQPQTYPRMLLILLDLDRVNPMVSSRLMRGFEIIADLPLELQIAARNSLQSVLQQPGNLSVNLREIISSLLDKNVPIKYYN